MIDDDGVTLIARNSDGSVAASKYLPGPILSDQQVKEDAAHFSDDTALPVEICDRRSSAEFQFTTHIGRRLPADRSRLTTQSLPGVNSGPTTEEIRPATILPRHLRG